MGLAGPTCGFTSSLGIHRGDIQGQTVNVSLLPWSHLKLHVELEDSPFNHHHFVNTGVPHLVIPVPDIERVDLERWGPVLRRHPAWGPEGANVNWAQRAERRGGFKVRTFERGVEGETQACGTGACALAVVMVHLGEGVSPVTVWTRGGDRLTVSLNPDDSQPTLGLQGPAVFVFETEVEINE
jgi:diaminopimelate epimerase